MIVQERAHRAPSHTRARIDTIDATLSRSYLEEGKVVIVAGFQGVNEQGLIRLSGEVGRISRR